MSAATRRVFMKANSRIDKDEPDRHDGYNIYDFEKYADILDQLIEESRKEIFQEKVNNINENN